MEWFQTLEVEWATCAFTEAGFLRLATYLSFGRLTLADATAILAELQRHPGYRYFPITTDWQTVTEPFVARLYGANQVTDAYLLGLAIREGYVLATLDRGLVHLAGRESSDHVRLLLPA